MFNSPLWTLENCFITPHDSAWGPRAPQRAVDLFIENNAHYAPGKAANAGGVATSQLEMAQNASMLKWSFDEVDDKLQRIMRNIYRDCKRAAEEFDHPSNLALGANIAGFRKVADAMLQQGVV